MLSYCANRASANQGFHMLGNPTRLKLAARIVRKWLPPPSVLPFVPPLLKRFAALFGIKRNQENSIELSL
jgi:hypothetical protein